MIWATFSILFLCLWLLNKKIDAHIAKNQTAISLIAGKLINQNRELDDEEWMYIQDYWMRPDKFPDLDNFNKKNEQDKQN